MDDLEDRPAIEVVDLFRPFLFLQLALAVPLEGAHGLLREPYGAAARVLGLGEDEPAPAPDTL